jgi:hypothetical protein
MTKRASHCHHPGSGGKRGHGNRSTCSGGLDSAPRRIALHQLRSPSGGSWTQLVRHESEMQWCQLSMKARMNKPVLQSEEGVLKDSAEITSRAKHLVGKELGKVTQAHSK